LPFVCCQTILGLRGPWVFFYAWADKPGLKVWEQLGSYAFEILNFFFFLIKFCLENEFLKKHFFLIKPTQEIYPKIFAHDFWQKS